MKIYHPIIIDELHYYCWKGEGCAPYHAEPKDDHQLSLK